MADRPLILAPLQTQAVVHVPADVGLTDGTAVIHWRESGTAPKEIACADCLRAFLRLNVTDPTEVVTFVREWGPFRAPGESAVWEAGEGGFWCREDAWRWEFYHRKVRAIRDLLRWKNGGDPPKDWEGAYREAFGLHDGIELVDQNITFGDGSPVIYRDLNCIPVRVSGGEYGSVAACAVDLCVAKWVRRMNAYPRLVSGNDGSRIVLDFETSTDWLDLFTQIAVQQRTLNLPALKDGFSAQRRRDIGVYHVLGLQLLRLGVATDLYFCSCCSTPYERDRDNRKSPKPGQFNYCKSCVESGEAGRMSRREWNRRNARPRIINGVL